MTKKKRRDISVTQTGLVLKFSTLESSALNPTALFYTSFIQNDINRWYSCNKINTTQIQISRQNRNGFFSNISHQMMI